MRRGQRSRLRGKESITLHSRAQSVAGQRLKRQFLPPRGWRLQDEIAAAVRSAAEQRVRVVARGPLVLFATASGDAWMLDPEDQVALRLARRGNPVQVRVTESEREYAIEWSGRYRIEGEWFLFVDRSGATTPLAGYPVRDIADASNRLRS